MHLKPEYIYAIKNRKVQKYVVQIKKLQNMQKYAK